MDEWSPACFIASNDRIAWFYQIDVNKWKIYMAIYLQWVLETKSTKSFHLSIFKFILKLDFITKLDFIFLDASKNIAMWWFRDLITIWCADDEFMTCLSFLPFNWEFMSQAWSDPSQHIHLFGVKRFIACKCYEK